MTYNETIDTFVNNWVNKQAMVPIAIEDISELELTLSAILPLSYKHLLTRHGLIHSPNVLTKTCDLNVAIVEVQDFLRLDDIAQLSPLYEMSGMPKGHILFASDANGNMFCFNQQDCLHQQDDIPVYFYHHGLQTVDIVSSSFVEWLASIPS